MLGFLNVLEKKEKIMEGFMRKVILWERKQEEEKQQKRNGRKGISTYQKPQAVGK